MHACAAQATLNGEVVGQFNSSPDSGFNELGVVGVAVSTLSLKAVDVPDNGWIALVEVNDARCCSNANPPTQMRRVRIPCVITVTKKLPESATKVYNLVWSERTIFMALVYGYRRASDLPA